MRLNMTQQGGLADEFMSGGGSVINPLFLAADPAVPLGASTKQYVDNSAASLNANNLITGTIGAARFPAMNGDLTSSAGSTTLTLSNTGVTPGAYPKVSVDNKGRVLNGLNLVESDLPTMSWNKITSDKPTTIDGYGITNAIKSTGGTMVGAVSVNGTPTQSTQLVNKSYLDTVVGGTTGIAVGDIISKIDPSTPVGFLKCNGAELVKTSYQDLYNAIGDRYTLLTKAGNGQPWKNQYDINTENYNDLNNWRTIQSLPGVLMGGSTFITKNRVYVFGGYNGSSHVGTGYTAPINNDGTIGAWSAATALPGVFAYNQAIVTKNKVYLLGGQINASQPGNIVYVADINADGTIGPWGNGPVMPGALTFTHTFINKETLYVVGGFNGSSSSSTVYSTKIKTDGSLESWSVETSLPTPVYSGNLVVIKNRVYLLGGLNASGQTTNIIYSASLNSDGSIGTWQTTGVLPAAMARNQVVITRNVIYIIGGNDGTSTSRIYKATVLEDGTLGGWSIQPVTLPLGLTHSNITITKNHINVFGGEINAAPSAICWTADISGGLNDYSSFYSNQVEQNYMLAGSGKPWQQQYQINATQTGDITGWITDSSVLPVNIRFHSTFITKNYVYVCGGSDGTNVLNTVYIAPINNDGTLGTWVTGGNLPGPLRGSQVVAYGNKVYLLGGANSSGYTSTVYSTTINADGTLGTWVTGTSLPVNVDGSQIIVTQNRIYLLGGYNGTVCVSTVYTAPIYLDGTIGPWVSGTNLPVTLAWTQAIVTKNRVYLLGGMTSTTTYVSTVYTAPVNSDGTLGAWVNDISLTLPAISAGGQAIVTKNRVYLLGGNNGTTALSAVYMANINNDGLLSSWVSGTSLPGPINTSQVIITKNRVYLLGGTNDNTTTISTIYSAPILEGSNDYSSYYAADETNYMMPGSGRPWEQQYQINTIQSADITGWTTSTKLPGNITYSSTIVTKNRVYLLGGHNGTNYVSTVYTAPINSDGTLGTWTTGTNLPEAKGGSCVIVTKNRVYLLGGGVGSGSRSVQTAPINSDGTLGTWVAGTDLPQTGWNAKAFITKNRVYLFGLHESSNGFTGSVYTCVINSDGTLGAWSYTTRLPNAVRNIQLVVTKNRVYLLGGYNDVTYTPVNFTAPINSNGELGTWKTGTTFPDTAQYSTIMVTKNRVYVLGGDNNSESASSTVYTAPINSDGIIGSWITGTPLPNGLRYTQAIATSSKIYLLGGGNLVSDGLSTVYVAPFSGGTNDYSSYMNGDILPIEQFVTVAKFKLPDASFMNDGLNYFIKF